MRYTQRPSQFGLTFDSTWSLATLPSEGLQNLAGLSAATLFGAKGRWFLEVKPETRKQLDFGRWIRTEPIAGYVAERQNADGGYTFAQWAESSAQDTYYALQILKMLGVEPALKERTIAFLKELQHPDGGFDSMKVAYYVTKSLIELGATLERGFEKCILLAQSSLERLGSFDVNIEASSEMETTYLSLETLRLLRKPVDAEPLIAITLRLRNPDGSFGRGGYSRMASVYYALASLKLLGYDMSSLAGTLKWIRACENPAGGFARSPNDFDAYLILEEIYYGLRALEALGEVSQFPSQNFSLIGKFQNGNGGFRRSIFLGISTFEDTFYALSSLDNLSAQAGNQRSSIR